MILLYGKWCEAPLRLRVQVHFCLQLVFTIAQKKFFNWEGARGEKRRFFLSFFCQEFSKLINREPFLFISVSFIVTMNGVIIGPSEKLPLINKMIFD